MRRGALAMTAMLLVTPAAAAETGAYWTYAVSARPEDQSSIVWASPIGTTEKDGGLALICKAGRVRVSALPVPQGVDGIEVRYRFDDGPWASARWAAEKTRLVLDGDTARAFAEGLVKARQTAWVQVGGGRSMMFLVDHEKDRALIGTVAHACRVSAEAG